MGAQVRENEMSEDIGVNERYFQCMDVWMFGPQGLCSPGDSDHIFATRCQIPFFFFSRQCFSVALEPVLELAL